MNKKHLFVAWMMLSLLLGGCATVDKRSSFSTAQQEAIKNIINEIGDAWSYNTQEYDLDCDGRKEAIVIYVRGTHHSGAKVLKFDGDKAEIIFDESCSTSNVDFKIVRGVPTIVLEDSDYDPDYDTSKRHKRTYRWNDKSFVQVDKAKHD
jgi:hypothetical protein